MAREMETIIAAATMGDSTATTILEVGTESAMVTTMSVEGMETRMATTTSATATAPVSAH